MAPRPQNISGPSRFTIGRDEIQLNIHRLGLHLKFLLVHCNTIISRQTQTFHLHHNTLTCSKCMKFPCASAHLGRWSCQGDLLPKWKEVTVLLDLHLEGSCNLGKDCGVNCVAPFLRTSWMGSRNKTDETQLVGSYHLTPHLKHIKHS